MRAARGGVPVRPGAFHPRRGRVRADPRGEAGYAGQGIGAPRAAGPAEGDLRRQDGHAHRGAVHHDAGETRHPEDRGPETQTRARSRCAAAMGVRARAAGVASRRRGCPRGERRGCTHRRQAVQGDGVSDPPGRGRQREG